MVELESEGEMTRTQVAAFLREFADELNDSPATTERPGESTDRLRTGEGTHQETPADEERRETTPEERGHETAERGASDRKRITFIVGGDSATVTVPHRMDFDVEVESRSPMLSSGVSQEINFDLSWEIENPDELDEDWIEVE